MGHKVNYKINKLSKNNLFLFIAIFGFLFIFPFINGDKTREVFSNIFLSAILLSAVFALNMKREWIIAVAIMAVGFNWIDNILDNEYVSLAKYFIEFAFLTYIVIRLIIQVAGSAQVTRDVIFSAINSYLLMGFLGAILMTVLEFFKPGSLNMVDNNGLFHNLLYFSFVTLTTLGYGDITPYTPMTKSLSLLIALSGQLYLTTIIAMLIGKFLNSSSKRD